MESTEQSFENEIFKDFSWSGRDLSEQAFLECGLKMGTSAMAGFVTPEQVLPSERRGTPVSTRACFWYYEKLRNGCLCV